MKKFILALFVAVSAAPAFSSTDIDTTIAKCSVLDKGAGEDKRTSNTCATGAQLPLVRWNMPGYTLFGDLTTKDIGIEAPVGAFKLGVSGAVSSEKEGDKEKHDSKGTIFAKKLFKFTDSKLDVRVSASRSKVFGGLRDDGAGVQLKYFFNMSELTPFAVADSNYKYTVAGGKSTLTSSFSLGMRLTVK
jgi:hypothetical protein